MSTDGGSTWRPASGTTSWTYTWNAAGSGSVTIKTRAFDDTGNTGVPGNGVTITVSQSRTCPCTIWASTVVPPSPVDDGDPASVELGDRFRTDVDGYITGVRFYKASLNTGTHTGSLWTSTGVLLGTVTFTGETASGWQQANFANPIAVTANTTYIVSYHAPNGHYTGTDPFLPPRSTTRRFMRSRTAPTAPTASTLTVRAPPSRPIPTTPRITGWTSSS